MDEADLSIFGKKKSKQDKADADKFVDANRIRATTEDDESERNKEIVSRATETDTYNSNNPHIGIAVILNHKDIKGQKQRVGTEKDRDDMKKTLAIYGFDVRVYDDLTFEELSDVLKQAAKEDHSQNDCFLLVVMSHGLEGKVYAKDMPYPVERLWNPFLGDNCKTLINKPKLFFIQACRGENVEKAVTYSEFQPMSRLANFLVEPPPQQTTTYAIPNTADILVMYSTFERYFSFRNVEMGSWFIQCLSSVLYAAARNEARTEEGAELLRLLTTVIRRVAYEYQSNVKNEALNQKKEMPNFMSTLTKIFYLKVKAEQ